MCSAFSAEHALSAGGGSFSSSHVRGQRCVFTCKRPLTCCAHGFKRMGDEGPQAKSGLLHCSVGRSGCLARRGSSFVRTSPPPHWPSECVTAGLVKLRGGGPQVRMLQGRVQEGEQEEHQQRAPFEEQRASDRESAERTATLF
ncbi:uncharacterized protein Tco025E_04515 [Trypanosoma conorhini]|uniref:Uncharacterized protein n=1 Tax=Trypanosoma conorhini TaxID=83891 RepID=A0A422PL24_9TRYP|nr:uncharacterized protein Tco025E_04515 [Trypanosoma conorhini]RNF18398.1 hypothetical protein Tco025E_04515 [Trypanosoma conorhini]